MSSSKIKKIKSKSAKHKSARQKKLERKFWAIFIAVKVIILALMVVFLYVFYKEFTPS